MKCSVMKVVLLMAILSLLCLLTGCDSADYKEATELYNAGSYEDAEAMFLALEDYEDSAEMALACRHAIARELMEGGNYAEAAKTFDMLADYADSQALAKSCRYTMALKHMDDKEYDDAAALFAQLGDYEEAAYNLKSIPSLRLSDYLAANGPLVYTSPEPAYTVTLSGTEDGVFTMEYRFESAGTGWTMAQVFTAEVTIGSSDAALHGDGYLTLHDGVQDDEGSCTWDISTYTAGDTVQWETYSITGQQPDGSALAGDAAGIAMAAETPLERMTQGVAQLLAQTGLDTTMSDLGFINLK